MAHWPSPLILLHGPTASGKTALALALAQRLQAEIVNADAMQVYADLTLITARPEPDELASAPHHLFGYVDGARVFSSGQWQADALASLQAIAGRGRPAIIVGGTGLYFQVLTQGLASMPPVDPQVRARVRAQVQADPVGAHQQLVQCDELAAQRIQPQDAIRIGRALEVFEATGIAISQWQAQATRPVLPPGSWHGFALVPDRAALYAAIDARFETMLARGALSEVARLAARNLPPDRPILKAHGVPHLIAHLEGRALLAQAIEWGRTDTRHYAKRQLSWIRHRAPGWVQISNADLTSRVEAILSTISRVDVGCAHD